MSKRKPLYEYEIGIPAHEYWVFRVKATSAEEAVAKIEASEQDVEQVYSVSCGAGTTEPKIMAVRHLSADPWEEGRRHE